MDGRSEETWKLLFAGDFEVAELGNEKVDCVASCPFDAPNAGGFAFLLVSGG